MDELPIGRRVAYWRNRRKMSQQVFADRLGKSKSWVDKVERGVRRLDKFSVVYEIADVLQLDVQLLLGKDPERRPDSVNCIDQVEVEEIRAALERYDQISAFFYAPPEPPPLAEMRKAVGHAWLTYQHAKYGVLARALPKLLRDAQAADTALRRRTPSSRDAAHLLGQVYQIASSALRKLGEHELAWLAADRSIAVVAARRRPAARRHRHLPGRAARCSRSGRARPALEVNVNIANRLAPGDGGEAPTPGAAVASTACCCCRARWPPPGSATARPCATCSPAPRRRPRELGGDHNHYWTCFGPTNVQLHRAAAAVELGEGGWRWTSTSASTRGASRALLPERRAHHYLDIARGYAQVGDVDQASEMLLEGDRLAPVGDPLPADRPRGALSDVLRRTRGAPPPPVAELAEHMGVGV